MLLSSLSSLAELIDLNCVSRAEIVELFQWLADQGDRVSQVGAIECGLRLLHSFPELEPSLAAMTGAIAADRPDDPSGRLRRLSALVALVEGEVARRNIARGRPPFWRRLTSIAHASLIEREVIQAGVDSASIADWALKSGGALYYMQTLIDLRRLSSATTRSAPGRHRSATSRHPSSMPTLKRDAPQELIDTLDALEKTADECWRPLRLLNHPGDRASWALLVRAVGSIEQHRRGLPPNSPPSGALLANLSRATAIALRWTTQHAQMPSVGIRTWDAELAEAADQAIAVGNNYSHFEVCFQGFHKDLYAAELVAPTRVRFTGDRTPQYRQVRAFQQYASLRPPPVGVCSRSHKARRRACSN